MTHPEQVKDKIQKALINVQVTITEFPGRGGGDHIGLEIVGDYFEGMSKIDRHQKIMDILKPELMSGSLHAVKLKILTPDELIKKEQNNGR